MKHECKMKKSFKVLVRKHEDLGVDKWIILRIILQGLKGGGGYSVVCSC
jgi:hypothetical protein